MEQESKLLAGVQALSALCRSFLGPEPALKCVISEADTSKQHNNLLVSSGYELLHALDGEPTSSTLLLELVEAQVQQARSGCTWLLSFAGLLLNATKQLLRSGVPRQSVLSGLDTALLICEQIADDCAVSIDDVMHACPVHLQSRLWGSLVHGCSVPLDDQPPSGPHDEPTRSSEPVLQNTSNPCSRLPTSSSQRTTYEPHTNAGQTTVVHSHTCAECCQPPPPRSPTVTTDTRSTYAAHMQPLAQQVASTHPVPVRCATLMDDTVDAQDADDTDAGDADAGDADDTSWFFQDDDASPPPSQVLGPHLPPPSQVPGPHLPPPSQVPDPHCSSSSFQGSAGPPQPPTAAHLLQSPPTTAVHVATAQGAFKAQGLKAGFLVPGRQRQVDGGQRQVDGGQRQVDGGQRQVDGGPRQVDGGQRQVDGGQRQVDGGQRQVDAGKCRDQGGKCRDQGGKCGNEPQVTHTAYDHLDSSRSDLQGFEQDQASQQVVDWSSSHSHSVVRTPHQSSTSPSPTSTTSGVVSAMSSSNQVSSCASPTSSSPASSQHTTCQQRGAQQQEEEPGQQVEQVQEEGQQQQQEEQGQVQEEGQQHGLYWQRAVAVTAASLSHGAVTDMQLAAATCAVLIHPLTTPCTTQQQGRAQQPDPGAQCVSGMLQQASQQVCWQQQVQVVPLCGPDAHDACVLPGVCLPLSAITAPGIQQAILQVVQSASGSLCREVGTGRDETGRLSDQAGSCRIRGSSGSMPGWPGQQGECATLRVGLLEAGLGLLAPCADGTDAGAGVRSALPAWRQLTAGHASHVRNVHTRGAHVTDADPLTAACDSVKHVLETLGVQVLLLGGCVPAGMAEMLWEMCEVVLIDQLPSATLTCLAAASGVTLASGVRDLQSSHAVALMQVWLYEQGTTTDVLSQPCTAHPGTTWHTGSHSTCTTTRHNQPVQLLCFQPVASLSAHAQAHVWPSRVKQPSRRAASVLLASRTAAGLQSRAACLPSCFARLQAALIRGSVLPGGGVFELMCAHALTHAAQGALVCNTGTPQTSEHTAEASVDSSSGGSGHAPAWAQLNHRMREDRHTWAHEVLQALAGCMRDIVLCLLQNQGCSFAEACHHLGAGAACVSEALRAPGGHVQGVQGAYCLQLQDVLRVQGLLAVPREADVACEVASEGGTNGAPVVMVGDDAGARVQALRSGAALVKQLLCCDLHMANSQA